MTADVIIGGLSMSPRVKSHNSMHAPLLVGTLRKHPFSYYKSGQLPYIDHLRAGLKGFACLETKESWERTAVTSLGSVTFGQVNFRKKQDAFKDIAFVILLSKLTRAESSNHSLKCIPGPAPIHCLNHSHNNSN